MTKELENIGAAHSLKTEGSQFLQIMSEEDLLIQRRWQVEHEIANLRNKIIQDIKDYKLLQSCDNDTRECVTDEEFCFLSYHISREIGINIEKLKKLIKGE